MGFRLEYIPKDTVIHRLNPLTKIIFVLLVPVIGFILANDAISAALISAYALIWLVLARIPISKIKTLILIVFASSALFMIVQIFFYWRGKTVIFEILFLKATLEGLHMGLTIFLKMMVILGCVPVLAMTTRIDHFAITLSKLKVPYQLAFALITTVRFLPLISNLYNSILDAQKLRAHDIDRMNFLTKLRKAYYPLIVPLFITSFRTADELQIALESRAFGAYKKRTYLESPPRFTIADYIALASIIGLFVISIIQYRAWGTILPPHLRPSWAVPMRY